MLWESLADGRVRCVKCKAIFPTMADFEAHNQMTHLVYHSAAGFVPLEESDRLNGIHPQQHIIDAQAKNRAKRTPTWWERINRWKKTPPDARPE